MKREEFLIRRLMRIETALAEGYVERNPAAQGRRDLYRASIVRMSCYFTGATAADALEALGREMHRGDGGQVRETEDGLLILPDTIPLRRETAGALLLSAIRYALGRRTYIVSETAGWIRYLAPQLDTGDLKLLIRNIEDQERCGYGHSCDERDWREALAFVADLLRERGEAGERP